MTPMIAVEDVSKSYGDISVLKNLTFDVAEHETFAVIGPNGAGKSTLFKVMTGEVPCNHGHVRLGGRNVTRVSAHDRAILGIGRTFQVARTFPNFTVFENIVVAVEAKHRETSRDASPWYAPAPSSQATREAREAAARTGLGGKLDTVARNLSHGDKKRLELAMVLARRPTVLMLDEPTAGMSPGSRQQITELIDSLRQEHRLTVILTEHDMNMVFNLADRIMVLNYGKVVALGNATDIRKNDEVRAIYLGSAHGHAGHP
jgi:branched-chain amino acid transport system ATP-binding protein